MFYLSVYPDVFSLALNHWTCCFTQLFSWEVACLYLSLMPVYANANSSELPGSGLKQEQMRHDWIKFTRKTILFDFDWNGNDSSERFVRNFAWGMTSARRWSSWVGYVSAQSLARYLNTSRFAYRAVYINSASCLSSWGTATSQSSLDILRWFFCLCNRRSKSMMAFMVTFMSLLQVSAADIALDKTASTRVSEHTNLVPMLEEPSSAWLLQEDSSDAPVFSTSSPTSSLQNRPSLPNIPDILILTFAALTIGFSVLLRTLCHGDQQNDSLISVKAKESTDAFGCTELHVAASEGSPLLVRQLLEGGSDPNARRSLGGVGFGWFRHEKHVLNRSFQ